MRVAKLVFGFALCVAGGVSSAASEQLQGPSAHLAAAILADGVMNSPGQLGIYDRSLSPSALYARDVGMRSGAGNAMLFVPSQNPTGLVRGNATSGERMSAGLMSTGRMSAAPDQYDPARIPLPAARSVEDHLLTGFIAAMLIAYQLRRKHRFLRPHQFST